MLPYKTSHFREGFGPEERDRNMYKEAPHQQKPNGTLCLNLGKPVLFLAGDLWDLSKYHLGKGESLPTLECGFLWKLIFSVVRDGDPCRGTWGLKLGPER